MRNREQAALRCIDEIDAVMAAVRYTDAACAALAQPAEKRRPDFEEWMAQNRARLQIFVEGRTAAPADFDDFAAYVKWLLKSYTKDARVFRRLTWFVTRVLGLTLPLREPKDAGGPAHPLSLGAVSWIFALAAVALWSATR